ncbi:restriction endonuclease subunit S [Yersinia intermedia]|uniref:restriction endonuclease subunit S n=1 Tax=Yersinia intermedia TaxID=631 RepID=UPI0011A65D24|nr:restriction endonuclease subunit S [Yersinia intermedia]
MLPRIRFPSFNGHYTEKSLHEAVLELKSGLSRMFSDSDIGLPVIRSNNIKDYCLDFNELKYWFEEDTQGATTSNYYLRDGDILVNFINSQAQIGKSAIYYNALNRDCIYTTNILSLRINKDYSPEFIFFFFQTKMYNDYIQSITKPAVNQASFTTKDFRKMKIFFPDLTEQTKIANFLSSVDEKIALLNKQYDLLCQYKKGMMQKIFSQELRFKDDSGRAFPEWKSTILDEVVDLITNGLALDQNDSKNGYPVSRIETISEHCINMNKVGFVNTDNDISNYKLNYGDMLFSNINSISHIGKIAYFNIDDTLYHGMNLLRIVIKNSHCKLFFYYQLTTDTNKKYFESRANQAVSQASINQTELRKTPVQVPCQEEQTKIASFLSALDDKIAVKKAELDKLKTWKQGLLQQMFV